MTIVFAWNFQIPSGFVSYKGDFDTSTLEEGQRYKLCLCRAGLTWNECPVVGTSLFVCGKSGQCPMEQP
jgi:hypothetical protein